MPGLEHQQFAGLELARFLPLDDLLRESNPYHTLVPTWNAVGATDNAVGPMDAGTYPNDNRYPIDLGIGFDQIKNMPAGRALADIRPEPRPNLGARTSFQMRLITSSSELRTTLALSAGAAASSINGGASGRAELYRETSLSRYSNFVMVMATVVFEAQGIFTYQFASDAIRKLYLQNPQRFYERYGTEFISSVIMGGEFIALYELHAETKTEYEAQKAALSGKVGIWSSSAEASSSFSEITNYQSTGVKIARLGPTDTLPTTPQDIIDYAAKFSTLLTPENAATIFFSTQSYARAAEGRESINLIPTLTALTNQVRVRDQLRTLRRDWEQVKTYPAWFGGSPSIALADEQIATIDGHLKNVASSILNLQTRPFDIKDELVIDVEALQNLPEISAGDNLALSVAVTTLTVAKPEQEIVSQGQWAGNAPIISVNVGFQNPVAGLSLEYFVHVADHGDQGWVTAGTPTRSWSHQGIAFRLTGPLAQYYSVRYRVNMRGIGQSGYLADGGYAGTRGEYRPIVQLLVEVVRRR